ncbi:polysaccharide biosynthesis/export family protein [uncultured Pelagimonas sp.]|uniref:polysaccharide biosynthesis/export family protein n=1 Tax=uncultured Pelagimonas sp. TaxID=1618102 RepID=UPI002603431A|nr:polysaccharide biosynthesis/export family protein [uncultured Pelagimonas sp.]
MSAVLGLVGCGGAGPDVMSIQSGTKSVVDASATQDATAEDSPYVLVEADRDMAVSLSSALIEREKRAFYPRGGPAPILVGRGDIISVAIVSTSDSGFVDFTSASIAPISQTELAPQEVGADGMIRVPPLGRVRVVGRSTSQIENGLTARLSNVLVDPSAIVSIADRRSAKVAVVGKVGSAGKYSIDETNLRLLDMVNSAGGPDERSENLRVSLSRQGDTRTTSLDAVLRNDNMNVFVKPGDVLELETPEDRIVVLGAGASSNSTMIVNLPDATLTDVLGNAGGLAGRTASRKGVYVYREMPVSLLQKIGADVSEFTGVFGGKYDSRTVPTIFRFDMTKPDSLFIAKAFRMLDNDILYIAPSLRDAVLALTAFVPGPSAYVGASDVGPSQVFVP